MSVVQRRGDTPEKERRKKGRLDFIEKSAQEKESRQHVGGGKEKGGRGNSILELSLPSPTPINWPPTCWRGGGFLSDKKEENLSLLMEKKKKKRGRGITTYPSLAIEGKLFLKARKRREGGIFLPSKSSSKKEKREGGSLHCRAGSRGLRGGLPCSGAKK